MRPGEVREIGIPQELWTGNIAHQKNIAPKHTTIKVELESIKTNAPQSDMPLRRFVVRNGSGLPLRCGELAMLHLAIWAENGEKIFSTENGKPVYFYLGENSVPYALERGVQGILPGGQYSLVFASELWKPLADNAESSAPPPYEVQPFPSNIEWPDNQLLLIDVAYPRDVAQKGLPQKPIADTPPVESTKPELKTPLSEPEEVKDPVIEPIMKE
jgi:hypothetical protein